MGKVTHKVTHMHTVAKLEMGRIRDLIGIYVSLKDICMTAFEVSQFLLFSLSSPKGLSHSLLTVNVRTYLCSRLPPRHLEPRVVCGHHPHGPPELHAGEVADVGKRGNLRRREAPTRRRQPRDVTMRNFPLSLVESTRVTSSHALTQVTYSDSFPTERGGRFRKMFSCVAFDILREL